jgi:hypothetical protein
MGKIAVMEAEISNMKELLVENAAPLNENGCLRVGTGSALDKSSRLAADRIENCLDSRKDGRGKTRMIVPRKATVRR